MSADLDPETAKRSMLRIASLVLILTTVAAYAPVFSNDFIDLEDSISITENPHVRNGLSWESFVWACTTTYRGNWQPLTWLSLQLDVSLYGLHPQGIHLTSLVLHTASSVLLFRILAWLTGAVLPSVLVAAWFAVHPMHVESVAWAAARQDVLGTLFLLLTVGCYGRYAKQPSPERMFGVAGAYLVSLLVHPMLAILPALLLFLDFWPLCRVPGRAASSADASTPDTSPRSRWQLVSEKWPLLVLAVTYGIWTLLLPHEVVPLTVPGSASLADRLTHVPGEYLWYLGKSFVPTHLALPLTIPPETSAREWIVSALVVLAITVALAWRLPTHPALMVGWIWSLTVFLSQRMTHSGDGMYSCRVAYLAHIGLFITVIWGLVALAGFLRVGVPGAMLAALIPVVVFTALTFMQVGRWHDPGTIWEHTLAVYEEGTRAHFHLGVHHWRQERPQEAEQHLRQAIAAEPKLDAANSVLGKVYLGQRRLPEAEEQFQIALRSNPDNLDAQYHLAVTLIDRGMMKEGIELLESLVPKVPDMARAHSLLGTALIRQARWAEALPRLQRVVELTPEDADTHVQLGEVLMFFRYWAAAEHHLRAALALQPKHARAHEKLGQTWARQGRWKEAAAAFAQGLESAPDSLSLRGNLALALTLTGQTASAQQIFQGMDGQDARWKRDATDWATRLATHWDAGQRDGWRAWELAAQACQASQDKDWRALEARALAEAELGRFDRAVSDMQRALDLTPDDPTTRQRLQSRQERFRTQKPLRLQQ